METTETTEPTTNANVPELANANVAAVEYLQAIVGKLDRKTIGRIARLIIDATKQRIADAETEHVRAVMFERKQQAFGLMEWLTFYRWLSDAAQQVIRAIPGGVIAELTLTPDEKFTPGAVPTIGPEFGGNVKADFAGNTIAVFSLNVGQTLIAMRRIDELEIEANQGDRILITGFANGRFTAKNLRSGLIMVFSSEELAKIPTDSVRLLETSPAATPATERHWISPGDLEGASVVCLRDIAREGGGKREIIVPGASLGMIVANSPQFAKDARTIGTGFPYAVEFTDGTDKTKKYRVLVGANALKHPNANIMFIDRSKPSKVVDFVAE